MKKLMIFALACICSSLAVSAQDVVNDSVATDQVAIAQETVTNSEVAEQSISEQPSEIRYSPMTFPMNDENASAPRSSVVVNNDYRNSSEYKSARTLRNVGCIMTWAGLAGSIGCFVGYMNKKTESTSEAGQIVETLAKPYIAIYYTAICMVPCITGAVMWIVGNHKMHNAKVQFTGNGLAFKF